MREIPVSIPDLKAILDFENSLILGSKVRAFWTRWGDYYEGIAIVVSISEKTFLVVLTDEKQDGFYQYGTQVSVPRINGQKWSDSNRLMPQDGTLPSLKYSREYRLNLVASLTR